MIRKDVWYLISWEIIFLTCKNSYISFEISRSSRSCKTDLLSQILCWILLFYRIYIMFCNAFFSIFSQFKVIHSLVLTIADMDELGKIFKLFALIFFFLVYFLISFHNTLLKKRLYYCYLEFFSFKGSYELIMPQRPLRSIPSLFSKSIFSSHSFCFFCFF